MILKFRIGHIRITFTIAHVVDVVGVNSKLNDGNHILMWDFDNTPLQKVAHYLQEVQYEFGLPDIHIVKTSEPDNYIAYCFKRCTWQSARAIVGMTAGIDENFYKWAVFRKRFTLRVGSKGNSKPQYECTLKGITAEDVCIEELKSWVKYETLDAHHNQTVYFFEVP